MNTPIKSAKGKLTHVFALIIWAFVHSPGLTLRTRAFITFIYRANKGPGYIVKSVKRALVIRLQVNEVMSEHVNYIIMRTKPGASNNTT